jgi:uncharacterized membrane protein
MDDEVLFQAVVTPHRSLSAAGLRRLILAICLLSLAVTTGCYLAGAWPVIGFSGVEIGLAVLLLRLNARRARRREVISLTPSTVAVERTDEAGRKSVRTLRAAWLNVVLEERAARVPGLFLRNRSEQVEVAREIGETEKRSLHADLRDALHRWRHPVFDNPQLRD